MNQLAKPTHLQRPARWAIVLAFTLVYLSWGTTYLAIEKGVQAFPPALFSGIRVAIAGLLVLGFLAVRGQSLRLPPRELAWTALAGILLFVGGNGLITLAETSVHSGVASVLAATSPFWMALLEACWPWGERLNWLGWAGLLAGLGGVVLLVAPEMGSPAALLDNNGPLLVLGSAFSWSVGSFLLRCRRFKIAPLTSAAYQMVIGGCSLTFIGLVLDEGRQLAWERCTPVAVYSFFHLLVVSSLVAFVAFNWLLSHVPVTLVGTYAYVNPVIAILVGHLLNQEEITGRIAGSMAIILAGVALMRAGSKPRGEDSVQSP